jgi:hypothetical protein
MTVVLAPLGCVAVLRGSIILSVPSTRPFPTVLVLFRNRLTFDIDIDTDTGILLKLLAIKISVVRCQCHALLGIAMETCLALAAQRAVVAIDLAPSVDLFTELDISHLTILSIKLSVRLTYFKGRSQGSKPQTEVQQALRRAT